ncbi:MAG: tRNA (cytidine(34)-2'-O)-methyltransferase [Phycisphaeraceae bacterium]|nr:tRNA (cytidine(34)-2'-O)-methyltransferase [Phycisphaeraceae bacterium]
MPTPTPAPTPPPSPDATPPSAGPLLHIVLHEPEIPNNTGNIGRTCVATGCGLHLIRPLGFSTSVKALRRAGLDYWPRLSPAEHESFDAYLASERPTRLWLFTTKADRPVFDAHIAPGDHLVFGKETRGLPDDLLARFTDRRVSLPMLPGERSLNLATAVCAAVYVVLGDMRRRGEAALDATGRLASWTRANGPPAA